MILATGVVLKKFETPDEIRNFEKGRFELVTIGGMTIGRASYEPGWKWSEHVGKQSGAKSCQVEHVGMVISGRATAAMDGDRRPTWKPMRLCCSQAIPYLVSTSRMAATSRTVII